jgi:hypothetical protein
MKPTTTLFLLLFLVGKILAQPNSIPPDRWLMVDQFRTSKAEAAVFHGGEWRKILFERGSVMQIVSRKSHLMITPCIPRALISHSRLPLFYYYGKVSRSQRSDHEIFQGCSDKKGITLHQLLTHSAGFPGAIGDDYEIISAEDFQKQVWSHHYYCTRQGYNYSMLATPYWA